MYEDVSDWRGTVSIDNSTRHRITLRCFADSDVDLVCFGSFFDIDDARLRDVSDIGIERLRRNLTTVHAAKSRVSDRDFVAAGRNSEEAVDPAIVGHNSINEVRPPLIAFIRWHEDDALFNQRTAFTVHDFSGDHTAGHQIEIDPVYVFTFIDDHRLPLWTAPRVSPDK